MQNILGTNLVQAVVIRLSALLSRKMWNRLAHALKGNGAMLVGNEVLAALFVIIFGFQTLIATTATTRTILKELLLAIGNFLLPPSFSRLASVFLFRMYS